MKIPQEDSFSSQAADCKSETQLKTRPPTNILQKPHPGFKPHVLEIYEHLFFKKLALNGCFLKKKKKNKTTTTTTKKKQKNKKRTITTTTKE